MYTTAGVLSLNSCTVPRSSAVSGVCLAHATSPGPVHATCNAYIHIQGDVSTLKKCNQQPTFGGEGSKRACAWACTHMLCTNAGSRSSA